MSKATAHTSLPVIAIGASAGGLEACRALFKDMPADLGAALVLILHLDPSHDSMMVELLARHTALKVVQATSGMVLEAGVLHVIPPGVFMSVSQGVIQLTEPTSGKSVRLPFDLLLRSLATDVAACIVLSGTGTDGSEGIGEIAKAGGLVIAQDPAEAGYPGMPQAAIATGHVAQTLPTAQMVAALQDFVAKFSGAAADKPAPAMTAKIPRENYDDLLDFVRDHAAQDISLYKRGTLERRISRRMALLGLGRDETPRYLAILQEDAAELSRLSADLLIHVTGFFRDPDVFAHLSAKALPDLVAAMAPDRPLRIWVAGCSTGEEPYSLAITCIEAMEAAGVAIRLQILASDVDPEAVATARTGFYSKEIEAVVSPERLARFFIAEDDGWRVASALRDVIVFTVADLLSDPPFSKIDLVSCRNLLIYLGPEAQKRAVARCCFALRRDGLLLLGAAEMPGQADNCFAVENKDARLWRRTGQGHPADLHFTVGKREEAVATPQSPPMRRTALAELCRRIVLEHYAPAAVLLNSRLDCLYMLGPTEKFLQVAQGHPDPGFVGMLPKALRVRVRTAAADCTAENPLVTVYIGRIAGFSGHDIALHWVPATTEPLLLACFVPTARVHLPVGEAAQGQSRHSGDLEADLEATRSDLVDALRDLEKEVEAHGADAAEAQSVNEEFQSTNEELLASKEELQSLNEELTALNGQLQETLERHRTTANDLQNVLYSTDVATLFLDMDLNIRFFTPAARAVFRVIPTDVGRPLADLAAVSKDDDLTADAHRVLASNDAIERETAANHGKWFLRRIQPYRAEGGRVEGVVITYIDVTERNRTKAALVAAMDEADRATRAKSRFLAAASHDLRQPLQSMALLHRLLSPHKRTTEGVRLATLMDQTLSSMTAMLDSMLDVNRIESGIVRPEIRPVPIAPLLLRLADEFGPQCDQRDLKLRSVPSSAWVLTDPQLLEQMLRNLLSNALKYTQKGGILIGCRRRGTMLTILVCDSGIGVEDSETKAIFDAYHTVQKPPLVAGHGLGLGLSIVQRLAELMDHPVSVRSSLGRGSSFMITLPIVDAVPDAPQLLAAPELKRAARQTGKILLVEDEEPLRNLLAEVLVKEGHTVVAHSTAQAALDWASGEEARPDLLLADFDLHDGSNGLTLAQDLPDVLGGTLPTIILTGDITTETLKRIAASSCHQVSKPVMPEVLLAQISALLLQARTEKAKAARGADAAITTIHVIDDDPMIREIMRRLFEAEGWRVISHRSAEDFLEQPRPEGSACLLVDNHLPGMNGVQLLTLLQSQHSQVPAVMLTGHGDAATAVAALKAGAADLIEKPASAAELLASVRRAIKVGGDVQPPAETRRSAQKRFDALTPREREVLARVLAGQPNKIIAADLDINQRTVENHRASVMRKTGAASLPALVRLALAAALQPG